MRDRHHSSRWAEDARWRTLRTDRLVLALARTPASTIRLLEILPIFRGSPVQVLFAFDPTSAYNDGVEDLIRGKAKVVPWHEIGSFDYDLALTASENVTLDSVTSPVVVLPHGIGFHKDVPSSSSEETRTSGVVPARYLSDDRVSMVVSHPDQEKQLRLTHPETIGRCVVVGDTAFDSLVASRPSRAYYRRKLGLRQGQRLVVVTSTWGQDSLFGTRPDLPRRLLAELPADEYRIALILHPNISSWHGDQRVDQDLAFSDLAGLLRIPAAQGWHATVIAADLIVGDNGSVTLYGAALDRPTLLGAVAPSIVPGTPPDEMARNVARISPDLPLREQVDRAIDAHRPGRFDALRDQMFAHQGEAIDTLRDFIFTKLDLRAPVGSASLMAVPAACPRVQEVRSFQVLSRLVRSGHVELQRFPVPAAVRRERPGYVAHLCVREDEPILAALENASVIVRDAVADVDDAVRWIAEALRAYESFMAVAAVDDGCVVGTRDGRSMRCVGSGLDPLLAGSGVYTLVRLDAAVDGPITIEAGGVRAEFSLSIGEGR